MKLNSTFIIVIVLVIGAVAAWYFFTGTAEQPPLTETSSINTEETEFKALINELPTSFDTGIFTDPRFNALVDLSTKIAPEPSGRLDPFAPVSNIGGR